MGIVPGQATVPEAYQKVAALFQTFGYALQPSGEGLAYIIIRDSTGYVPDAKILLGDLHTARLAFLEVMHGQIDPNLPTLGDVVSLFGSPACLVADPLHAFPELNAPLFYMFFDSDSKTIFKVVIKDADGFSWEQPIDGFTIWQGTPDVCVPRPGLIPWQGLKRPEQYLAEMQ
jgi:hypothetical protein